MSIVLKKFAIDFLRIFVYEIIHKTEKDRMLMRETRTLEFKEMIPQR